MIIAGNWKMYKLIGEAHELAAQLKKKLSDPPEGVTVILCPPFTALAEIASVAAGSPVKLGAQNVHWEEQGAYTGEVSALMLKDAGCTYVIIGHSERRQYFGETDETVSKKAHAAIKAGLKPIICVGETEQQRERNQTEDVIVRQVKVGLAGFTADQLKTNLSGVSTDKGKNATQIIDDEWQLKTSQE